MSIRKKEGFDEEKLFVLPDYMASELATQPAAHSLYVTDIGYFPRAKYHYRERLRGCDASIMIFCIAGEGWVECIGEGTFPIRQQTVMFIPEGMPHRYGTINENPWSIYWLHLKGHEVRPLLEAFRLIGEPIAVPTRYMMKFIAAFDLSYELLTGKPYSLPSHRHISQTIRQQISSLGMSADGSPQEKKRAAYIDEAIRYMTERLNSTCTLDELARYVGLSRQHLIEVFHEATGFPPIDYFLRIKMQRASQMLDLTDMSVKQIAGELGFRDPLYFSRAFKKINGISPSEYRSIAKG